MSRRLAVTAAAALAGLSLLAGCGGSGSDPEDGGPLREEESTRGAFTVRAGEDLFFGQPVLFNRADEPVHLAEIRPKDPPAGLEVVRTEVAGPKRSSFLLAADRTFPPRIGKLSDRHPVRDFSVEPASKPAGKRGVELVFVLRAKRQGRYAVPAWEVVYRAGDQEYRRQVNAGLGVCAVAPGRSLDRSCSLPPKPDSGE